MPIFKDEYIKAAKDVLVPMLKQEDPNISDHDVEEAIESIYKARLKDPTINMDNNITGDNQNITLTKLCGWIRKENPVISGNATFYCQPSVLRSPTSNMLKAMKAGRKKVKKAMFKFKPGSDEYARLDLEQGNQKVIMNAEYGASGAPTSAFYTKYGPSATTAMAQSLITVMAAFFESYIGDNQLFFNLNECFDWMAKVSKKDKKIPKWVKRPTKEEVFKRIRSKFYMANVDHWKPIELYINSMNDNQLTYLYYANNIKAFIGNHKHMQDIISKIMTKLPIYEAAIDKVPDVLEERFKDEDDPVLAYNRWMSHEMFLNPYEIPDTIKDEMDEFIELMSQFVYVEYITPDSIVKLNNHSRNTVLLVDTDSNIINADLFVSYLLDEIFPGELFGRDRMYDDMILVNVLAATLSVSVADILDYYGRMHNMDEESRAELTMKNEFMFRRFFLMKVKKRYASSIVLREGNIIVPFKPEIKGMDFVKAGVSEEVSKRFQKMLCDHILFSDELELHELMRDLKKFEQEIRDDLAIGGTTYLKQAQYKSENAYASNGKGNRSAWTLPVFYGSAVWNELFPENKITSLDRVSIAKMNASSIIDIEPLQYHYPESYEMLKEKIFNNQNFSKNGMRYLCIPNTVKLIPEWLIPLVNVDAVVSDVISSFQSVLDALGLENVTFKTQSGTAKLTSCIISM